MDPLTIGLAIAGTKKLLESANDLKDIAGGLINYSMLLKPNLRK
jgi:hypothetical protein